MGDHSDRAGHVYPKRPQGRRFAEVRCRAMTQHCGHADGPSHTRHSGHPRRRPVVACRAGIRPGGTARQQGVDQGGAPLRPRWHESPRWEGQSPTATSGPRPDRQRGAAGHHQPAHAKPSPEPRGRPPQARAVDSRSPAGAQASPPHATNSVFPTAPTRSQASAVGQEATPPQAWVGRGLTPTRWVDPRLHPTKKRDPQRPQRRASPPQERLT